MIVYLATFFDEFLSYLLKCSNKIAIIESWDRTSFHNSLFSSL